MNSASRKRSPVISVGACTQSPNRRAILRDACAKISSWRTSTPPFFMLRDLPDYARSAYLTFTAGCVRVRAVVRVHTSIFRHFLSQLVPPRMHDSLQSFLGKRRLAWKLSRCCRMGARATARGARFPSTHPPVHVLLIPLASDRMMASKARRARVLLLRMVGDAPTARM